LPTETTDLEGLLHVVGPSVIVRREEYDHALRRRLEAHVRRRQSG
jgi:hypothetical protein